MNASSALGQTLAEANANFALDLLREVSHCPMSSANTVLSPFSLAITLAMIRTGAQGQTAREMDEMLTDGVVLPRRDYGKYFVENATVLHGQLGDDQNKLEMANKIYSNSPISDNFLTTIWQNFGENSEPEVLNFSQSANAAKQINQFAEKMTNGRIHSVIVPGRMDGETNLVLISGIFFKGILTGKFNRSKTVRKAFHVTKEHQKQVEMVHLSGKFIYHENDAIELFGVPFEGGELFLFVLLPKERFGMGKMLERLEGGELVELLQKNKTVEMEVIMPKLRLSSVHDLNEPLKFLGIWSAFGHSADFGGISAENLNLKISQVAQKATFEFDGSDEYSSAENVQQSSVPSGDAPAELRQFLADHPFAFFVYAPNGPIANKILFAGIFTGSRW